MSDESNYVERTAESLRKMAEHANTARGASWEHGALSATTYLNAAQLLTEQYRQLEEIKDVLARVGCDCACDHHYTEGHDDDCDVCLGCEINAALRRKTT